MISPTRSMETRIDRKGTGQFGSPRGWRIHQGIDLVCGPEASIYAPEDAKIVRAMLPCGKTSDLRGILLKSRQYIHKILYCELLDMEMSGCKVKEGGHIGISQDIRERYGDDIAPHIHWEVIINPTELFDG